MEPIVADTGLYARHCRTGSSSPYRGWGRKAAAARRICATLFKYGHEPTFLVDIGLQ